MWLIEASNWMTHLDWHRNQVSSPHQTPEYRRARTEARRTQGDRCRVCGRTRAQLRRLGLELHTHHVSEDSEDHRQANLRLLCEDHHPRGGKPAQ